MDDLVGRFFQTGKGENFGSALEELVRCFFIFYRCQPGSPSDSFRKKNRFPPFIEMIPQYYEKDMTPDHTGERQLNYNSLNDC